MGEWRIYRWWGWLPPEAGVRRRLVAWLLGRRQVLLYVGQTGRMPLVRALEHALGQPWAGDALVLEVDSRVWPSEAEVLAVEAAAIRRERPLHNIAHSGTRPGAVRMRRRLPRHVAVHRRRLAGWFLVWLVLTVGLAWAAAGTLPAGRAVAFGAVTASVGVGWAAGRRVPRRRR